MTRPWRSLCCLGMSCIGMALTAACTKTPTAKPCESTTRYDYNPEVGSQMSTTTLPDDYLTVDNSATVTGVQVSLTVENSPWIANEVIPSGLEDTIPSLNKLDGWGTTSGITLRFTAAVKNPPTGSPASLESKTLQLWELGASPHRVPFETQLTDDNDTIILWPMVPLRPSTLHAVLATRDLSTAAGDPLCPSAPMVSLLDGSAKSASMKRLVPRYAAAMKAAQLGVDDIGAAVTFTTQSILEQSVAIAQDIKQRTYAWKTKPTCVVKEHYKECGGVFVAQNYQTAGVVEGTTPVTSYDLPVRLWLPLTAPKPWPTMIFGHGLGGDKDQGEPLGVIGAEMGIAVIAIDAIAHGEHPDASTGLGAILKFFGMSTGTIQPLVLRDNWRQSTYDKLQLLRLLETVGDADGDDQPDLDLERFAYYGVSLGGIMGGEFLALQDRIDLAILAVPGSRVMSIISDAQQFAFLPILFKGPTTTDGDVARFFPVMQALIDRGDSANYANHVLHDRLPSANARTPSLSFMMVLNDDTVPNVCNNAMARALGVPQLPPVLEPVGVIPLLDGTTVSGNEGNGTRTAALFQFDRITTDREPAVHPAEHPYLSTSVEGLYQTKHLLETWLAGTPEIVNPYAHFNTPPLSAPR